MSLKSPRNVHIWLPGYLKSRAERLVNRSPRPTTAWLMIADHFEPLQGGTDVELASARVKKWCDAWPAIAERYRDSSGKTPQYTFFYPQEEYRPELIDPLAEMAQMGIGDVEVHLHHDGEGEQDFLERMRSFRDALHERHGMLRSVDGRVSFAFIHGNWVLDNSHPQGRFCGLNNEIALLKELGCYADFTLPAAPNPAQTRIVNTIYWAIDDPLKPKSHDTGIPLAPGKPSSGDLLMIPGPLGIRLGEGRMVPRIEMGEIAGYDLPSVARARLWLRVAPRLGDSIFIKLHTHGIPDRNMAALLNGGLDTLFRSVETACREIGVKLRYGTAWQVYNAVLHAAGMNGPAK